MMKKEELSALSVSTKQQRIAQIAQQRRGEVLTLLHHYIDENWLKAAYKQLRKSSAPGIDRQTVEDYGVNLEANLKSLLVRAKSGRYKAPAVRRVMIPKPGKKEFRPLGIPTTEDKILQRAVLLVLAPIYELEFYEFSFGFREYKSAHQGLEYLRSKIMDNRIEWIIDLDIRKFFDSVNHRILQEMLRIRVRDGVITRLIGKWLNAGILEDQQTIHLDKGTPQGGIVSPLLCNLYLHEAIDKWYALTVKPKLKGQSLIVRFADDVIMGFEHKAEAERVLMKLTSRLKRLGLEFHPEKTSIIHFKKPSKKSKNQTDKGGCNSSGKPKGRGKKSFDFLGFTHYWGKSRRGYWIVKQKTSSTKMREKLRKISDWCKAQRHAPITYQHEKLCLKIKGHYSYYGITGNAKGLQRYLQQVRRIWKKWLSRRSWKGGNLNWKRFEEKLKHSYPLPPIKVVHSIYAQRNQNMRNRMR